MNTIVHFSNEGASADLTFFGNRMAKLSSLYAKVPRKGYSTALMHQITAYADANDLGLYLVVRRFRNKQGLDNEQLVYFYMKFGFQVDDFYASNSGVVMIRKPNSQELQLP